MTQKLLDRLIFIDYCADNNIITQDRLHAILHTKGNIHSELIKIFSDMDEKFNSELFAHSDCDDIQIEDEIIRPVIIELSNTDFSKLSVHIIGEVYENYLGELLKQNKRGVKVEESKSSQKKKSQGIYYTPDYIVNHIVENSVGVLLSKCKTIKEIENVRVLDPACGSGSFLIRVFDEFLKHYERISPSGLYYFDVRKKILQKNIYGVDLDERAVEIAKLNLLVKALEGSAYTLLSGRKILPSLKLNIRCGNSLVSGEGTPEEMGLFLKEHKDDIHKLKQLHIKFNDEQDEFEKSKTFDQIQVIECSINSKLNNGLEKIFKDIENEKPFNYTVSFPVVFEDGGFNCVIGNPPYVRPHKMESYFKEYLWKKMTTFVAKSDLYSCFMERGLILTKSQGLFSFITPHTWTSLESFEKIRKFIINNSKIKKLVQLPKKVFSDATVETCIFVLEKTNDDKQTKKNVIKVEKLDESRETNSIREFNQSDIFKSHLFNFQLYGRDQSLGAIKKVSSTGKPLSQFVLFQYGFKTDLPPKSVPPIEGKTLAVKN